VSCFDRREDGDVNDNWIVKCTDPRAKVWVRDVAVRFVSETTRAVLHSHSQHRFTQRNCPNCPIIGQQEVTGFSEHNPQVSHLYFPRLSCCKAITSVILPLLLFILTSKECDCDCLCLSLIYNKIPTTCLVSEFVGSDRRRILY
jgi:hypothetical protein